LSSNGNAWNITSATGITLSASSSTINLTGIGPGFIGAGLTYGTVGITYTGGTSTAAIDGINTIGTLNITAPTAGVSIVNFNANQTITTLSCAGASAVRRILLRSDTIGTARTLTVGTYTTKTDVDFRDITAAGASSPWSGTRLGNCGGNTSITFVAAKTVYWNLTGTQNWSATAWATTSGGTPAINNFPLAQDTAVFDDAGAATTVTIETYWQLGTVDISARTSAVTLTISSAPNLYGNWVNGSGLTLSGAGTLLFSGASAQTITSAGKSFACKFTFEGTSVTLQDALSSTTNDTGVFTFNRGTFDANNYNVTCSAGDFTSSGTITRTLAMGSGTWTFGGSLGFVWDTGTGSSNLTITGSATISFTSASAKTFRSSAASYSAITINQGGAGRLELPSRTFYNITNTYSATGATTISFSGNMTVTEFTASGEAGRVLTLKSSSNGTARTLKKTSGTVSVDYMSIRDSTATGGAGWYAGANSTSVSNNTGWVFTAPPVGNFFLMFM